MGVTASEGDTLRAIMFSRQQDGLPLFFFDRSRRTWYLNIEDYPDGAQVIGQLKEWDITVPEYRQARGESG